MRASIACTRCRRSKTKCDNQGAGTTCKSCEIGNKTCDYQDGLTTSTGSGSSRRREGTVGESDAPPKKRKRTLAPTSSTASHSNDGINSREDILDLPLLTAQVWEELFDIYEKHFATDFPFFHRRRFLLPLHRAPAVDSTTLMRESVSLPRPPHDPSLLLAFLTQTARFHSGFVSRLGMSPVATADFLAEATRKRMGYDPTSTVSLERTQALLMLGFHEWTELQGERGWLTLGNAIRCAQLLRYQYDDDRKEAAETESEDDFAQQEKFIDREVQRRTFWSCFMMDRYLSCGTSRPQMLSDVGKIQLPCSDRAFSHGQRVKTRLLGESDQQYKRRRQKVMDSIERSRSELKRSRLDGHQKSGIDNVEWEVGRDEGELSLYIQAVDHFGKVMKWSNAGGRQSEDCAPWDSECGFKLLEDDNKRLKAALPPHFILTPRNTDTHISYRTSRNYVLVHALHTLCTIALYREYMPFLPWNVQAPQGPLDEPRIKEPLPKDQPDYWTNQARVCFGAAKDFANLLKSCQPANAVVETPIAGWATYIVAWCALYCHFFPRMDPDRALDSRLQYSAWEITHNVILNMRDRLKMAAQWIDFLIRLHKFFKDKRGEWKAAGGSPGSNSSDNSGWGLKEYSGEIERAHKEFGSLEDQNWSSSAVDRNDLKLQYDHESEDRSEAQSPAAPFKREGSLVTPFTAVNGTPINKSGEMDSVAGSPAQPYQAPQLQPFEPSTHTVPVQAYRSQLPSYNTVAHQNYFHGPLQHESALRASHGSHQTHNASTRAEPFHPSSQPYYPQNWQQINSLELAGQPSMNATDLASLQCAQGRVGETDSYYNFYAVPNDWTGQVPFLQGPPPIWNETPPFDANYSNTNFK